MNVEELFSQYKNDVYRLALSYTRNREEAADVCQTVFLKAMEHRITPGKEKSWLLKVTANECRSLLRSGWWKRTVPLEDCDAAALDKNGGVLAELLALEPKYRVVLYLHYFEGSSTAEIGKLLHITQSAVTTRLSRGRKLLKDRMEEI